MHPKLAALITQLSEIIIGKEDAIRMSVACLLARGHLLIEDIPGVGKTTLSQALARSLGLEFKRIQFTSDLLPADILGNSVYDTSRNAFVFHPGPIFTQVVFIDEINRATPKTQSALLEVMEENQVSIDGKTYDLPSPFFVIATQNPHEQIGTFPLPESQLDRFMLRIHVGYPDRASERAVLTGARRQKMLKELHPVLTLSEFQSLQDAAEKVHVSSVILDYVQDLLQRSRELDRHGLSPRAGLAFLRAAQAWAFLHGRDSVWPEDLQQLAQPVMGHRLSEEGGQKLAQEIIQSVEVPV
jgi:MoxR-like ATPase